MDPKSRSLASNQNRDKAREKMEYAEDDGALSKFWLQSPSLIASWKQRE